MGGGGEEGGRRGGGGGGGSEATVNGAIAAAGITPQQMLAVAVTIGPGLSLCLQVCVV